ncbi:hypothetical protein DFH29DRAFT_1043392 [Suillus ampliporus]|nr:hypothetical protein DFH29DRAFT_1043392 [Suillus ampliporus]
MSSSNLTIEDLQRGTYVDATVAEFWICMNSEDVREADVIARVDDPPSEPSSDTSIKFHLHIVLTCSSSTADKWLAGLRFWHVINGAQWHGERSECLHQVQRGLHRLAPPDSNPEHRPPITLEALVQLHQGLDLSFPFDVAVLAITCLAFWCGCRLGDPVVPAPDSFDIIGHVTRSILPIITYDSNNVRHATFHIPWTKTTGTDGADINVTARNHLTCPHAALIHHLKANPNIPSHAPSSALKHTPTPGLP